MARLAVPELIFEMRRRGHDEALIRKVVHDNPLAFFSQCARYDYIPSGAIEAVEQSLLQGKRRMLVAMATGTGKTLTAIALLYRLMKSDFARRVLFLVDRRAEQIDQSILARAFRGELS